MVLLKNIYGEVIKEFPDLDTLAGADLSFMDLREADFSGMDLVCTDFSYADLEDAVFEDADLLCADFHGTCYEYHCSIGSGAFREWGIKT